ncbi:hypothetical protein FOA52_008575 [Chlamydomonas sp. UWO 241]|nr:hypothetical protein FOA52_008575 [Chlamydomonas sp. UWO 241]
MVARASVLMSDQVLSVMHAAGFGGSHGYLDPSPHNEAGAAYYVSGSPGLAETRTLVMCRVEGNPTDMAQFRVTVVSTLPALSASVKDMLTTRLRA